MIEDGLQEPDLPSQFTKSLLNALYLADFSIPLRKFHGGRTKANHIRQRDPICMKLLQHAIENLLDCIVGWREYHHLLPSMAVLQKTFRKNIAGFSRPGRAPNIRWCICKRI